MKETCKIMRFNTAGFHFIWGYVKWLFYSEASSFEGVMDCYEEILFHV